jgi:hypothetical protein
LASLGLRDTESSHNVSLTKVVGFSPPRSRVKKGLVIDTKLSAAERMKIAMGGGQATKSEKQTLLSGDVSKLAEDIISALVRQGIIRKISR